MSNVISLFDYRKQREEQELDEMAAAVKAIIEDLGDELEPKPYFSYDYMYPDTYNTGIALNDVTSCCTTLRWISYVLSTLGREDEAGNIDNIVTRLEVATNGE